ncbi:hypothetical protein ACVHNB_32825 [Streptomyces sp. YJ-C3]
MALRRDMPIRDDDAAQQTTTHTTTYQASRGGYYPPNQAQSAQPEGATHTVERADK